MKEVNGPWRSLASALAWGARGPGFKSRRPDQTFQRLTDPTLLNQLNWPMGSLYRRHRFPPGIISHAIWLYHRFALSFRDVEDLLAERGITVSYEAIRSWCRKFGPEYARTLRRRQGRLGDIWHVDELFITIRGQRHYLWRAVDLDGDVLDILVTRHRDQRAATRFFRKILKHEGRRTERSSPPSLIEPGHTTTTELKSPTSTLGRRNAGCVVSNRRHTCSDFSRSTARFTTCSE
jgi:hypothetical protein